MTPFAMTYEPAETRMVGQKSALSVRLTFRLLLRIRIQDAFKVADSVSSHFALSCASTDVRSDFVRRNIFR